MPNRLDLRAILFACIPLIALCSYGEAQTSAPGAAVTESYGSGSDFVADIEGVADSRNWGKAGYQDNVITFNPPPGYRVHILAARGTVSSFSRNAIPSGSHAGLSWGLIANTEVPSGRADLINDACISYVKQSLSATKDVETTWFSFENIANGLLGDDNKLISRSAVYLNEAGPIHIEISLMLTYRFEKVTTQ